MIFLRGVGSKALGAVSFYAFAWGNGRQRDHTLHHGALGGFVQCEEESR